MTSEQSSTTVAARISNVLNTILETYANQNGSSKSDVIENSLERFFDTQQKHQFQEGKSQDMGNYLPIYSLSDSERRILLFLAKIGMSVLKEEEDPYGDTQKEYDRVITVLTQGYVAEYDEVLPGIFPEMTIGMTNEAHKIMEMFNELSCSYDQLSDEDKGKITKQNLMYLHCLGFDFNDSYELSIFDYLKYVRSTGRWETVYDDMYKRSGNGNSHMKQMDTYRLMLKKYERIEHRHQGRAENLTVEEIIDITTPYPPRNV
jgi:uncharacterized protein YfbU (UPF0304 family)